MVAQQLMDLRVGMKMREVKIRHVITLAPMNLSFSTIQESKKTKALLQQNRAETSVAVSFFKASKYKQLVKVHRIEKGAVLLRKSFSVKPSSPKIRLHSLRKEKSLKLSQNCAQHSLRHSRHSLDFYHTQLSAFLNYSAHPYESIG